MANYEARPYTTDKKKAKATQKDAMFMHEGTIPLMVGDILMQYLSETGAEGLGPAPDAGAVSRAQRAAAGRGMAAERQRGDEQMNRTFGAAGLAGGGVYARLMRNRTADSAAQAGEMESNLAGEAAALAYDRHLAERQFRMGMLYGQPGYASAPGQGWYRQQQLRLARKGQKGGGIGSILGAIGGKLLGSFAGGVGGAAASAVTSGWGE